MSKKSYFAFAAFFLFFIAGTQISAAKSTKFVSAFGNGTCSVETGQSYIEAGNYSEAIDEFTCVIAADPSGIEGYRGRIEAQVLLRRYSDAVLDYQRIVAFVLPVHPDAENVIHAGYAARLAAAPDDLKALTGASFAQWWFFHYAIAIHQLNHILELEPDNPYANLFRGSSRFLLGATKAKGAADLERALSLDPLNAHVRFIVADANTYGQKDPVRAFSEAQTALDWGLNTPRIRAILAASYSAFGDQTAAAEQIKIHFDQVTVETIPAPAMFAGTSQTLAFVPGRTYRIPLPATAGQNISILTGSRDFFDSIVVLLAPDGTPVTGSDDFKFYFAGFDWTPEQSGTYQLLVTTFESVSSGNMTVSRD